MNLSPVAIFTYARKFHLERTVNALIENYHADRTDVYFFSDGYKKETIKEVKQVRSFIKGVKGFKSITIIEREKNFGLSENIKLGISFIFNIQKSKEIIVVEDDIVTSKYFLEYMNVCLNEFRDKKIIGHVNSWSYPFEDGKEENIYFSDIMNCWGWGTWSDRWNKYNNNISYWENELNHNQKVKYDLNGSGEFWPQLLANKKNKIKTWAIFWYLTILKEGNLCVTPEISYSKNIGHDGTGQNSQKDKNYQNTIINERKPNLVYKYIRVNKKKMKLIERYIKNKQPLIIRILKKLRSLWY
tara:strand:- start:1954 stop:2853 length:900 start_codon:yes stop_codon:yes gene_type:complete